LDRLIKHVGTEKHTSTPYHKRVKSSSKNQ